MMTHLLINAIPMNGSSLSSDAYGEGHTVESKQT